ncbi:TPA: PasA protein [Pseudomonas putida]|nr:PasA protein [Pseudomonas putida]
MAQELYTRTNQKLFFAGLALESMAKAEHSQAMNAQGLIQAEREAAVFHLYGALLGLCHEIAGFYRLPQANAARAELLLNDDTLKTVAIPEMAEMLELARQPQTWLAQLIKAYADLFQPPVAKKVAKTDVTQPLIQAVNLDEVEEIVLSRAELERWRQDLKGLVRRFREALSEC